MCHNADRPVPDAVIYPGGIQDVIQNGATVGCLDCHDRQSYHMDHLTNDQDGANGPALQESSECTPCHTGGGVAGSLTDSNFMNIHNYSGNSCGTCHQDSNGSE